MVTPNLGLFSIADCVGCVETMESPTHTIVVFLDLYNVYTESEDIQTVCGEVLN